MALSPWTISNQSEKTTASTRAAAAKTGQPKPQNSFADLMAREQTESSADKSAPTVSRLPERGLPLRSGALAGRSPSDLLRAQNFTRAGADVNQVRNMDNMMRSLGAGGSSTLDIARSLGAAKNLRIVAAANQGKGFALSSNDFIHTRNSVARATASKKTGAGQEMRGIGRLSAKFESGSDGIAAIGYDSTGGTSYGKFQIASRVGTMKSFLSFLDAQAPDLAKRLRGAGPANTGSRRGGMPNEWRQIAREQPERFEKLQEDFVIESHYKPALNAIEQRTGLSAANISPAMREVIWSTAVQHGPAGAARIFERADAMSGKSSESAYERKLINNVYSVRAGQFGSSSKQVRQAVLNRFREEKQLALNMLGNAKANRA